MKQHSEPIHYLDAKDVQEGDILNFVFGHRWYFGKVEMIHKELFIVLLNNSGDKFKLKLCSCFQRVKGGDNMVVKKKSITKTSAKAVEAEKPVKVKKLTRVDMDELGEKIVKFMQTELKISNENLLKINRRCWLQLKEIAE